MLREKTLIPKLLRINAARVRKARAAFFNSHERRRTEMIAVLKNTATKEQVKNLVQWFEGKGLKVNESQGDYCTVLGLIGDTTQLDIEMLKGLDPRFRAF